MPIRSEGTDDYLHFRTIYDDWICPVLAEAGFDVVRADDVQAAGAITKDVVLRLASADLVVADLTDLNPNVFYELGVRHALRGAGTLMILDEGRTQHVPFDLTAYRVIMFHSDLIGIGKLRRDLAAFAKTLRTTTEPHRRDNPVHDWIPTLPLNAAATSTGSEADQLRIQLAGLERKLRDYEQAYGLVDRQTATTTESASGIILSALQQANQGTLASDLVRDAHSAAGKQDSAKFLSILNRIVQGSVRLSPREYLAIAGDATALALRDVARAIFGIGRAAHPKDEELRSSELGNLAHSHDPADLDRARVEIAAQVGIIVSETDVVVPDVLGRLEKFSIGIMLDAFERSALSEDALRVTTALVEKFPDSTVVARNHARALDSVGRTEEALEGYRRALWTADVDDTSAVWLGSELHNRRRHVDALEAYLLACLLDLDEATNFGHVAEEIARSCKMQETLSSAQSPRRLPDGIGLETAFRALIAACSCRRITNDSIARCTTAVEVAEFDVDIIGLIGAVREGRSPTGIEIAAMKFPERAEFSRTLYQALGSPLTIQPV